MKNLDGGFPIYILDDDTVLFSKEGWDHPTYWENIVSKAVAEKHKIDRSKIVNLPYSQKRARVVENNFYCGEEISKKLFNKIQKLLKLKLNLVYDEHETRCPYELAEFKGLLKDEIR